MNRFSKSQVGLISFLLMVAPNLTTAHEFPHASQAAIVQSCSAKAPLPKCMCYLSELQKRISQAEMAAVELALRSQQQADKKSMKKISEAQVACFQ